MADEHRPKTEDEPEAGAEAAAAEAAAAEAEAAGAEPAAEAAGSEAAVGPDEADEEALRRVLGGLNRAAAPANFGKELEETIRRRSAGRFFGRRAFGDRVPFEVLAIVGLVIGLLAWFIIRSSDTGSLRYEGGDEVPQFAPGAEEVVPKP